MRAAVARGGLHGLLLTALLLLGACAEPPPRRNPVMTGTAVVADEGRRVEVLVRDVPPGARLEAIVLVAPDGVETPAGPLVETRGESGPGYGPTGLGVSISGGSSSGVSTGVTLGINSSGGGGSIASDSVSASIAVPDPAKLLADRRAFRVELRWIEVGGTPRVLALPWR